MPLSVQCQQENIPAAQTGQVEFPRTGIEIGRSLEDPGQMDISSAVEQNVTSEQVEQRSTYGAYPNQGTGRSVGGQKCIAVSRGWFC